MVDMLVRLFNLLRWLHWFRNSKLNLLFEFRLFEPITNNYRARYCTFPQRCYSNTTSSAAQAHRIFTACWSMQKRWTAQVVRRKRRCFPRLRRFFNSSGKSCACDHLKFLFTMNLWMNELIERTFRKLWLREIRIDGLGRIINGHFN